MKSTYREKRKVIAEMNVIPYIDIMLVLLVIFMVTTPLIYYSVQVQLPQTDAKHQVGDDDELPMIVTIDDQGTLHLSVRMNPDERLSPQELVDRLVAEREFVQSQGKPIPKLYVRGSLHADYQKVVEALVAGQKAGFDSVGLMTENHEKS